MTTRIFTPLNLSRAASFDDLADGYYEADLDGYLIAANRSLCRMMGIADAAQLVGDLPRRFIDAESWTRVEAAADRMLTTGEPAPLVECAVTCADGAPRVVELSIAPLQRGGQVVGFCGIVRDVSERQAAAAESERLIADLQAQLAETRSLYMQVSEVEQLKTHMIRIVAHDLRSPLSIITSYVELLNEDLAAHYDEMDAMYVNAIRQAITRITQMTSDILSLERLHAYRDISLMRVQLGSLLENTLNNFADEMRQRKQTLSVSIEPLAVYGDSTELREAITNLIGNAIKYTPAGGTITASLRRDADSALLEIADTGYGIPADQQDGLFQAFHRVKTRETSAIDGTGLGLYLVKSIVERHGGSIHFQSEYGQGSRFGFRLPLAKTSEA